MFIFRNISDVTFAQEAFKNLNNFRIIAVKKETFDVNNFASEETVSGQSCKHDKIPKKLVLIFTIWQDKVKLNHHCREVGIEEPLQLASGGVDDAPAPLIEGEELGEDPEIDIDLGASSEAEKNVVV